MLLARHRVKRVVKVSSQRKAPVPVSDVQQGSSLIKMEPVGVVTVRQVTKTREEVGIMTVREISRKREGVGVVNLRVPKDE